MSIPLFGAKNEDNTSTILSSQVAVVCCHKIFGGGGIEDMSLDRITNRCINIPAFLCVHFFLQILYLFSNCVPTDIYLCAFSTLSNCGLHKARIRTEDSNASASVA